MSRERPRVVAAAVRMKDGTVHSLPPPARHCDVLRMMLERGVDQDAYTSDMGQGFLMSDGEFYRRKPAYYAAEANGQLLPRRPDSYQGDSLFSEDVW